MYIINSSFHYPNIKYGQPVSTDNDKFKLNHYWYDTISQLILFFGVLGIIGYAAIVKNPSFINAIISLLITSSIALFFNKLKNKYSTLLTSSPIQSVKNIGSNTIGTVQIHNYLITFNDTSWIVVESNSITLMIMTETISGHKYYHY